MIKKEENKIEDMTIKKKKTLPDLQIESSLSSMSRPVSIKFSSQPRSIPSCLEMWRVQAIRFVLFSFLELF